jgi:hypothetical protein
VRLTVVDWGANNEPGEPENRAEMLNLVLRSLKQIDWKLKAGTAEKPHED